MVQSLRDAGIPVAITMAGGYAENVDDVVDIHFATIALAVECWGGHETGTGNVRKPRLPRASRRWTSRSEARCDAC